MDLDRLNTGEKIAAGSGILLFIFMFFDWFSVSISGGGGFSGSAGGGSAWDALEFIPIVLVVTILVALAVAALRLSDSTYEPPVSANMVVAALGALSALLILYRIVDAPGGGSFGGFSVDVSPAFGIFISLIAAAGIAYGGYRAMQEEGSSFSEVGDHFSGGSAPAAPPPAVPPAAETPPQPPRSEGPPPPPPPPPPPSA
jgi:hypothetical protein